MTHWTLGEERGLLNHPHAPPPQPRPHVANDLAARTSRLEEHVGFAAWDRGRIERESLQRGLDNASAVLALSSRLQAVEMWRERMMATAASVGTIASWLRTTFKIFAAGTLFALWLLGKLTVDHVRVLGSWLGLPNG